MSQSNESFTVTLGKSGHTCTNDDHSTSIPVVPATVSCDNTSGWARPCWCYLSPHDSITQVRGPLDEDVISHAPVEGRVRQRLVARDGRILEQSVGQFLRGSSGLSAGLCPLTRMMINLPPSSWMRFTRAGSFLKSGFRTKFSWRAM